MISSLFSMPSTTEALNFGVYNNVIPLFSIKNKAHCIFASVYVFSPICCLPLPATTNYFALQPQPLDALPSTHSDVQGLHFSTHVLFFGWHFFHKGHLSSRPSVRSSSDITVFLSSRLTSIL